jgi:phosphoglycerate dehydrogenase-like enzyme
MLDRMPACRVVARFGTGLDTVDQAAAAERDIRVVSVRDYCIPELTTHTLGLAFALDRRLGSARDGRMRPDDSWHDVATRLPIPGRTSATVVGFGSIGAAATRALLAVGIGVRVVTRHGADAASRLGATPAPLDDALADAGFVFLHTSLEPATANLIDAERLKRMAPGAILINTARIGLIDEAAVARSLKEGRLGGLALDAKLRSDSPLRDLFGDPRFLVTPHIGWYSDRSARELRERTVRSAIGNAGEFARAARPPTRSQGDNNEHI